ncbi:MAG: CHAP domain-containing protein [Mogibacterium diversum]|uniref:CHAP domain-containing protein n=1 Tax=Mogibacterium diversum TaxID=114527 RepID=UPI002045D6D1|nr:CHAP domain-containing protein [Mogibacterium diversum]UQF80904.1 MAG: CHAP domain-containing protein [Mogibacterium diversum]
MSKKRKRDLNERIKAKKEASVSGNDSLFDSLGSKRKVGDDYRNKLTNDENRFDEKLHEKESKRITEASDTSLSNKSKNAIKRNLKNAEAKSETGSEKVSATLDYQTEVKENRIYDPLAKDQDGDGVADRYDTDFRDSEISYEPLSNKKSKLHEMQKKAIKRKNYSDDIFTRKGAEDKTIKDTISKTEESTKASSGKKVAEDRAKKNRLYNRHNKETLLGASAVSVARASDVASRYLSTGSDENKGVEAAEKGLDTSSKLIHGIKNYSDKRRMKKSYDLSENSLRVRKKKSKLEFREAKEEIKKNDEYKKASAYKKFQKRKQMKAAINGNNQTRIRDRIKKGVIDTLKGSKELIVKKAKGVLLILIGIIFLGTFVIQFSGGAMSGVVNSTSSVLTTSYLSSEEQLKGINQYFSGLENDLYDKIENVESDYPGYDEYIVNQNGFIGHNVHELLSYITARFGEVKNLSEVRGILDGLFNDMYKLSYDEEIEIRYRTVTETYTDEDGNEYTESHEEPYEYKKLIVTLDKKEMDSIIREVFAEYPDNLKHYEALFLAQGNMAEIFGNTDLINSLGGVGNGAEYEASSEVQKKIVDAAFITPSPGPGWCAMWVSQVYQNAGLGYIGGNANDMYRNYTFTSDRSKLKVGMLVAVESSSSGSTAGLTYGHVGIYIGDGKVIDNIGHIRVTTLDDWIATFCKHHPVGYGFPPNVKGH